MNCTGKEFLPGTCGVVWRGAGLKRISYCPLHASAPQLLAALKHAQAVLDQVGVEPQDAGNVMAVIRKAISRAEASK